MATTFHCEPCGKSFASNRGLASHNGRVHMKKRDGRNAYDVCNACGAVIGNEAFHEEWHARMATWAESAHRADVATRPIGPTTFTVPAELAIPAWLSTFSNETRKAE